MTFLLESWCRAMISLRVDNPSRKELDGGLLCPACGMIHGRCHEAVYPMMFMADATGEKKYLDTAKKLFKWGANVVCHDGAVRNDIKSEWKGVTAFAAIALHDAIKYHSRLLSADELDEWNSRLYDMGRWLCDELTPEKKAYINYYAANACAMALLGQYFGQSAFVSRACELLGYCLSHVTENGLLYGEGIPNDALTPNGCRAIDIGYNVGESLPSLYRCAVVLGDDDAANRCRGMYRSHLEWMLPDGAWDDSVGTRAFKWTYWGSRTADGCQAALFDLGRTEPVFAEAAWRNFRLLRECTHDGLLYGGPDYYKTGIAPCVHHTFCQAKTLALALDGGVPSFDRVELRSDSPAPARYLPELDTYRLAAGPWRADVTGYDFKYMRGDHASGGALSLLWHKKAGPLIASAATDFTLKEPFNQQLPPDNGLSRSPCPRIEAAVGSEVYANHYDHQAVMRLSNSSDRISVCAQSFLCDADQNRADGDGACVIEYILKPDGMLIEGKVPSTLSGVCRYVLPLIGDGARLEILRGFEPDEGTPFFAVSPGFAGIERSIVPDGDGAFTVRVSVSQ